jgi:hypothetical protein
MTNTVTTKRTRISNQLIKQIIETPIVRINVNARRQLNAELNHAAGIRHEHIVVLPSALSRRR